MRVRATVLFLSVIVILALTSQGVPVAQQDTPGQDTPGQAPAGRGGGGGRGGGAARSQAERDYVAPVRSPQNKPTVTVRPVTDAMLRNPDPGDWLMFRRTYDAQSYSQLDKINKNNVKDLELVWSWGIE